MTFKDEWTSDCGTVRLICGDCLEVLPTLEPAALDAVVTDHRIQAAVHFVATAHKKRSLSTCKQHQSTPVSLSFLETTATSVVFWRGVLCGQLPAIKPAKTARCCVLLLIGDNCLF